MTPTRLTSLGLAALLAAAGCGKSRGTGADLGMVTLPGGAADGSDVTVEAAVCSRCHGDPARAPLAGDAAGVAFAPPADVSGETAGPKVGAHMEHLRAGAVHGEGYYCSTCHVIPQDPAVHVPGVLLRGLAQGTTATAQFTPGAAGAAGSCSSTYCHGDFLGGNAVTMAWNAGPLGCNGCHGRGTGGSATPPVTTHAAGDTLCGNCHPGYTQIDVNPATHVDGKIDGGCTGCHGTSGRANGGIASAAYDPLQNAAPPVDASGASTGVFVGAHLAHVNPVPSVAGATQPTGGVYKPIACTECHPDNRVAAHDGTVDVTFVAATGATLNAFPASDTPSVGATAATCNTYCHDAKAGGSVATWSWTGAAATCGSCHGFPPAGHSASLTTAAQCNGCHGGTVKADGTIDIAGGKHINGTVEGGGESAGGVACGSCHSAIAAGMTGAATSKHALTSTDPAFQTGVSWSAPLSGTTVANRSCTNMCHDDHPHEAAGPADHSYNLYTDSNQRATTATTSTRARTDFDAAAANGGPCLSCHRFSSAATGAIDKAAYDTSAHDYTTSTWTWEYALHLGTFARNCTKCHASAVEGTTPSASATGSGTAAVHFNSNPTLLAGTTSPIAAGNVCFNCHGSAGSPANGAQGNRSGKNIQAQFAKANPHDSAGSCVDCHAPHAARGGTHATPGNKAGPPIQGAAGAALATNPAFWTAPAAGAFTPTTIVAGTDVEATLCFKCHSAFGGTLPAGTTDTAREFNPNNSGNWFTTGTTTTWSANETAGGFHPVLSDAGNNLGRVNLANLQAPWSTTTRNLMTCTDCHESNSTTDPNGPHGSTAAFILKGPNIAWNASSAATSTGMPGGVFCSNCHSTTWASSRFTGTQHYSRSAHRVACMNCHARVPHGGPRPGILIAPAGAASGVGGTIAGWDTTAPYFNNATTGSRLYIASYPSGQASAWGQSNCGCNGTGH
jgi:predicted CxxxxCH...CXXCH cytochrome family protein